MNEIRAFNSDQFGEVRTVTIDDEPWFVAADVCRALEIGNSRMATDRLDDDEKAAVKLADEIVRGASENINIGKTDEKISLSIGIAIYRGQEKNYSELFKKADIALYEAKADPDNRFYIYE